MVRYRFDNAEMDVATFDLRVDGQIVPVEPQVFEVLRYLIEHRDRVVPRTELLDNIWGDRFVSDGALASRVAAARAALGDDGRTQRMIRTAHGRGFLFLPHVEVEQPQAAPPLLATDDTVHQSVHFARTDDGTQLAVATIGSGPPLVKAGNWLTNVDKDWNSPVWRHWMRELGHRYRYIRYDPRGGGLSDRDLEGSDLTDVDRWTDDLEVVVESCRVERFALLGMSQGTAPAVAYAVRHPERVSHLVLYGGYARGMRRRGAEAAAEAAAVAELIRVGWGGTNPAFRTFFTMTFMPDASSEQIRVFNELQTDTADSGSADKLESAFYDLDLAELARQIAVPTMVIHCRDDMATPYEEGRRLASLIPGAQFVTLDSRNHVLMADEPAWPMLLDHIDRFLAT